MACCVYAIGSRRIGSDPLELGTNIRPYSLPTALGLRQELGGYVRAASWGPPNTTLSSFLPPTGDASTTSEVSRRSSLTSSLIGPAEVPALGSTLTVQDLLRHQQSVTCLPPESRIDSFALQKPPSTFSNDCNIDEIRQSLLSLPSLNSVFATCCNSPFNPPPLFDQSVPSLSDSSHQLPFPSVAATSLQLGTVSGIPPPAGDPNFNAAAPLGQLATTPACSENFWQTSCLTFAENNLYQYAGNRMVADISRAAAATDNNENLDDSRQDSSLWRPY